MKLNEYQEKAMTTCMPSCDNFSYMMLNLVGEVGEFASKVAKAIRKEKVAVGWKEATKEADENNLFPTCSYPEWKAMDEELKKEAGDNLKEIYWTSETDSDPQYDAYYAVFFHGNTGNLVTKFKSTSFRCVRFSLSVLILILKLNNCRSERNGIKSRNLCW